MDKILKFIERLKLKDQDLFTQLKKTSDKIQSKFGTNEKGLIKNNEVYFALEIIPQEETTDRVFLCFEREQYPKECYFKSVWAMKESGKFLRRHSIMLRPKSWTVKGIIESFFDECKDYVLKGKKK